MAAQEMASRLLATEARALLTRLARIKPFALQETMLPAAGVSRAAQGAIEDFLAAGRRQLRGMIYAYLGWLHSSESRNTTPARMQRGFTFLKLRFNALLTQFEIFSDAITQRSENETGVRLAGLDVLADDALRLPGRYYDPPPVICYLDRGIGAAIRRARTRLPGGGDNPVAIVRIPRERMVGNGIASSLVHEVGHQGAALLDLVNSIRPQLKAMREGAGAEAVAWELWDRWISEIVADFWSVGALGISSTLGLMGVVSLPRAFVFRISMDDPHPFPWIRVKLSAAMGRRLYPTGQWDAIAELWEAFYPRQGLDNERLELLAVLESTMPAFVETLVQHRPIALKGSTLAEAVAYPERTPERLTAYYDDWRRVPEEMREAPPALVFAVIGQARAEGRITPEQESKVVAYLLTYWALRRALGRGSQPPVQLAGASLELVS